MGERATNARTGVLIVPLAIGEAIRLATWPSVCPCYTRESNCAQADLEARMAITLGRHVVADPSICHGRPCFRGTRILVADVLENVATGMAWDALVAEWGARAE